LTELLVSQCSNNINSLSRHTFGSLTVRAVLNGCIGTHDERETILQRICDALAPHSVSLARDHQGNLVLQAAIRRTKLPTLLAKALMPHAVPLCLDFYGNRVVQRLLECFPRDSDIFLQLTNRIETHKDELEVSKYGKFVLFTIENGEYPAVGPDFEDIQAREDMLRLQGMPLDGEMPWSVNNMSNDMSSSTPSQYGGYGGYDNGRNSRDNNRNGRSGRDRISRGGRGGRSGRGGHGGHRGHRSGSRDYRDQDDFHLTKNSTASVRVFTRWGT
jgi:hypothetical protein